MATSPVPILSVPRQRVSETVAPAGIHGPDDTIGKDSEEGRLPEV